MKSCLPPLKRRSQPGFVASGAIPGRVASALGCKNYQFLRGYPQKLILFTLPGGYPPPRGGHFYPILGSGGVHFGVPGGPFWGPGGPKPQKRLPQSGIFRKSSKNASKNTKIGAELTVLGSKIVIFSLFPCPDRQNR